jgi:hypothetical protein
MAQLVLQAWGSGGAGPAEHSGAGRLLLAAAVACRAGAGLGDAAAPRAAGARPLAGGGAGRRRAGSQVGASARRLSGPLLAPAAASLSACTRLQLSGAALAPAHAAGPASGAGPPTCCSAPLPPTGPAGTSEPHRTVAACAAQVVSSSRISWGQLAHAPPTARRLQPACQIAGPRTYTPALSTVRGLARRPTRHTPRHMVPELLLASYMPTPLAGRARLCGGHCACSLHSSLGATAGHWPMHPAARLLARWGAHLHARPHTVVAR